RGPAVDAVLLVGAGLAAGVVVGDGAEVAVLVVLGGEPGVAVAVWRRLAIDAGRGGGGAGAVVFRHRLRARGPVLRQAEPAVGAAERGLGAVAPVVVLGGGDDHALFVRRGLALDVEVHRLDQEALVVHLQAAAEDALAVGRRLAVLVEEALLLQK